ncbi:hypothetical protein Pmani_009157 [Petrolisthes manimaculis]|uniref:Uncharacterized protein n=1 Tax=Petrolisthes manimaculis TaxID=1843537 RepID=A0AAE1UI78_9EUCA|nr:hypothetical protein Pmani_009157 [Petrolisthes manimaculis]
MRYGCMVKWGKCDEVERYVESKRENYPLVASGSLHPRSRGNKNTVNSKGRRKRSPTLHPHHYQDQDQAARVGYLRTIPTKGQR